MEPTNMGLFGQDMVFQECSVRFHGSGREGINKLQAFSLPTCQKETNHLDVIDHHSPLDVTVGNPWIRCQQDMGEAFSPLCETIFMLWSPLLWLNRNIVKSCQTLATCEIPCLKQTLAMPEIEGLPTGGLTLAPWQTKKRPTSLGRPTHAYHVGWKQQWDPYRMNQLLAPGLHGPSVHRKPYGSGSKNRYQNGTLVSGNMDQNLRTPPCLILSHSHMLRVLSKFGLPELTK